MGAFPLGATYRRPSIQYLSTALKQDCNTWPPARLPVLDQHVGFARWLIAGDPLQLCSSRLKCPKLADLQAGRSTCLAAKGLFCPSLARPWKILDAFRPQVGEYRPRSTWLTGLSGQNGWKACECRHAGLGITEHKVQKLTGRVGSRPARGSEREASDRARSRLPAVLRREALDLYSLDRLFDGGAPNSRAKVSCQSVR